MKLTEKYRPKTLQEIRGQEKAIKRLAAYAKDGLLGSAWYITGPTGTGKSTLAYIMADAIPGAMVQQIRAREINAATIREIDHQTKMRPLMPMVWIVNEAHELPRAAVTAFLDILETVQRGKSYVVIFTTTWDGAKRLFEESDIDAGPFSDRCNRISLTNQGLSQAIADLLAEVAAKEGIEIDAAGIARIIKARGNTFRGCLDELEAIGKEQNIELEGFTLVA